MIPSYPRNDLLYPKVKPYISRNLGNNEEDVSLNDHDWIIEFTNNFKTQHVIMYAGEYEYETDTLQKHKISFSSSEAVDFSNVNIANGVNESHALQGLLEIGCGKQKGCFGYPPGCINYANCEVLVTYRNGMDKYGKEEIHFELKVRNG